MMLKEMRFELRFGLLVNALFLVLNQFSIVPEILLGFLAGFAICFMIVGILPNNLYLALKARKESMFKRQ